MNEWQDRVRTEKAELTAKLIRLGDFMKSGVFQNLEEHDRKLLEQQYEVMDTYCVILEQRIVRFK